MSTQWFGVMLSLLGVFVCWLSWQKSKSKQFYSDTFLLLPMGIFVWGDGIILGAWWAVVGLIFTQLSPLQTLRWYLLFVAVRSGFEAIYWINHQVANREYRPPFLRHIQWLSPADQAVLYQLINTCWMITALGLIFLTF